MHDGKFNMNDVANFEVGKPSGPADTVKNVSKHSKSTAIDALTSMNARLILLFIFINQMSPFNHFVTCNARSLLTRIGFGLSGLVMTFSRPPNIFATLATASMLQI